MTIKGFMGKILEVDLTNNSINTIPLNENLVELFVGGAGYATAYLLDKINKDTDPLGPNNILFLMGGPFLGIMGVNTSRITINTKSPVSGILGEANCGGQIGVQLKKAGYDGLIVKGSSEKPVYIEIDDDNVSIQDASHLWGKGIYETHEILKNREGWTKSKVMCIGPAGENLVNYAIIASEERAFGRCGVGAVMGSKKLKAVIAKGSKKPELADPEGYKSKVKEITKQINEVFTVQMFQALGTSGGLNMYAMTGEMPAKYYRGYNISDENADQISGATLQEKYLKKNRYCYACSIGCGRIVEVGENDLGLPTGEFEGPEYENIAGFGPMIENYDLLKIIQSNYLCNDLGLDTISASSVISLLMDLNDRGKISSSEVDGLDLSWGNMETVNELLRKISFSEGIGKLLGKGSDAVGEKFNIDQDQIATIMHIEPPYHDVRSSNGMSIAYAISPHYGASHCACDMYQTSLGQAHESMDIESISPKENSEEMAIHTARLMEYRAFYSALNMCVWANPDANELAKMIELGTGMNYDLDRIKITGQRLLNLKRLFNLKMGLTPKDEKLPKILTKPIPGGTEENIPDTSFLFKEFYKYEDWDPETGKPTQERLEKLDLKEFARM